MKHKSKTHKTVYKKTRPSDTSDNTKAAIVFFDQETLNTMKQRCIDAAEDSEWQIHHLDLRIEMEREGTVVSLFFPMAFYNFDQEVGPSSVEWETKDSSAEAEKSKEFAIEARKSFFAKMPIFSILKEGGFNITFDFGDFGSIHRHPGRFGFSSIDKRKDPDDPGVIYRRAEAENLWQIDSIMYMDEKKNSDVEIYTTECRIVNVSEADDGGIKGTYCSIPTFTVIRKNKDVEYSDGFENVFGKIEKSIFDQYTFIGSLKPYPLLTAILEMFKDVDYGCNIDNVVPERIKKKTFSRYFGYGNYGSLFYGSYNSNHWGKSKTKEQKIDDLLEQIPYTMGDKTDKFIRKTVEDLGFYDISKILSIIESKTLEMAWEI